MPLTLEQLDQFGNLEQIPYSFDHNWETDEVCGSWTLEELDNFGNLDSIQISFDNAIWTTACIKFPSASITADATVSADGVRQRTGEAIITANATVVADGQRVLVGEATITATGTVVARICH